MHTTTILVGLLSTITHQKTLSTLRFFREDPVHLGCQDLKDVVELFIRKKSALTTDNFISKALYFKKQKKTQIKQKKLLGQQLYSSRGDDQNPKPVTYCTKEESRAPGTNPYEYGVKSRTPPRQTIRQVYWTPRGSKLCGS
jgi:hypothetical protein